MIFTLGHQIYCSYCKNKLDIKQSDIKVISYKRYKHKAFRIIKGVYKCPSCHGFYDYEGITQPPQYILNELLTSRVLSERNTEYGIIKWYKFDEKKGYQQKRPPIRKFVLVKISPLQEGFPGPIVVAYRKDHAGDRSCPYFITPGCVGPTDKLKVITHWADCLGDDFEWFKGDTR